MARLQRLQMKMALIGRNISIGKFGSTYIITDVDNNICRTFSSVYKAEEYLERML